jgi:hypothetical protein
MEEPAYVNSLQSSWTCPSCGSTATTRYCATCGERRDAGVAAVAVDPTPNEPARSYPARLHASLKALASPPGQLTADWIRGRRVGYLAPLSLFLWVNVAFFLVQSATRVGILTWPLKIHLSDDAIGWLTQWLFAYHRPDLAAPTRAFTDVFDALEAVHAKSLVIVMVPAFAAALALLLLDRRARFKDLLTFALHFYTFTLVWLSTLFPLVAIVLRLIMASGRALPSDRSIDLVVSGLEVAAMAWYLHVALGTVFGLSMFRRTVTAAALMAAVYAILLAYHAVVFAVTLYST